ncbi:GNAT family N-acetyltransferase [Scleromatobacter humisilvae]|uniref:GNAT family N-acetyltransferase n=1 Tax=Scleromatobacter humisilvae TaxID=2897159 RepID=A0A9X2BY57_9BURK|nr:GNAT family N-acetyltransferase [Scleromatobacter humisilvae]MCK9685067.1 GNAT family N-acetyltransferase [Scleromatobacter humisilvae]
MTSNSSDHPLDNVMWTALTTAQRDWSRGNALARRFRPEFARFAGVPIVSEATLTALAADMAPDEVVALSNVEDFDPGPLFEAIDRKDLVQMVGAAAGDVRAPQRFRPLGPADVPRMTALVQQTEPGPWFERTPELGRFVGFEADGRLVAMVGERMRVPGHTEISAVCCHPDWRGQGLPADLMRLVSQAIVARGETPFLHVLADNASAIALYGKLGLRPRLRTRLTILQRNGRPVPA